MAKAARKLTGFLWALLIAVLSFFIIFIFFPDVSNRFFGVSVKGEDVQKVVETVSETVSDAAGKVAEKAVEAVTEKLPEIAESSAQTVSDGLKQYSNQGN